MNKQQAIIAFSQSEKIKAGLIWMTQTLQIYTGLSGTDRQGAESVIKAIVGMIAHEVHLAHRITEDDTWKDVEKHIDMALVMINSQVLQESGFHLTRALSQVTTIGQRSLTVLKEERLL
jgi:RNA:NAD 2'-phosphotransferase (TPT1/KptA family)